MYEGIKFKYFFDGIVRVYVPDFYLVDYSVFIEIKPKCFQSDEVNILKLNSVRDKGYQIFYVGDGEYNNIDYIKSLINRL
nr:MAG TPA: endodeoxyribonuclease I [Bacteriophage sp.]